MGGGPILHLEKKPGWLLIGLVVVLLALGRPCQVQAEDQNPPTPSPSLEQRLQQLEAMNRAVLEQNRKLLEREQLQQAEVDARYQSLEQRYEELRARLESKPAFHEAVSSSTTLEAMDQDSESLWQLRPEAMPERPEPWVRPLKAQLGEGFEFKTADEEYSLRLRILDQTDFKSFVPGNQFPAKSGLYIPRVRLYFEGELTRLFGYEVSLQRSVDGVWDLLDANLKINADRRFQMIFGRQLVPYSYDWYDHLEQHFITPERALFPLNFGLSREAGLLARGLLFDDRLQYALGGFDGRLVGVADDNNTRDAVGYLNARPFLKNDEFPLLKYLNVGASGFIGRQLGAQAPLPLRTSIQSSENDEAANQASSEILRFREDVVTLGQRYGTALHLAWYYKQFSLESEVNSSHIQFARSGHPGDRPLVPIMGSHVTAGYFLTGETVTGRNMVDPLRPLQRRKEGGVTGLGAVELFARYSRLTLSPQVFHDELADPNAWTRQAYATDVGWNWYLNRYIKLYFDWQHVGYGSPVLINPNTDLYSRTNDLFWMRCQVYF